LQTDGAGYAGCIAQEYGDRQDPQSSAAARVVDDDVQYQQRGQRDRISLLTSWQKAQKHDPKQAHDGTKCKPDPEGANQGHGGMAALGSAHQDIDQSARAYDAECVGEGGF